MNENTNHRIEEILNVILKRLETIETFVTRYPTPPTLKMKAEDEQTWKPMIDTWLSNRPAPRIFKLADMLRQALDEDRCSHKLKIAVGDYLRSKGYQAEQLMHNGDRGLFWREGLPIGWQGKLDAWLKTSKKTYFTNSELFLRGIGVERKRITQGAKRALAAYLQGKDFEDRYTLAGGQLGRYWLSPEHIPITSTADYYPEKSSYEYDKPKAATAKTNPNPNPTHHSDSIIIDNDWGDYLDDDDDLI